jgi:hypothetical protein
MGSLLAGGKARAGTLEAPPGPIGPTGRALDDIEPRTPVDTLPPSPDSLHHITQGGSYKLTGHLNVSGGQFAIRISTTDPVSIDLAGFTISGGGGGGGGIALDNNEPPCAYVEVCDGFIRDMAGDGIDGGSARVLECYDLHIDNVSRGIVVRGTLVVEGCHIERCASDGILWDKATADPTVFIVDDAECRSCGGHGIQVSGDWTIGSGTLSITDTDVVGNGGDGIRLDLQNTMPGGLGGQLNARIQAVRATVNSGEGLHMEAPVGPLGTGATLVVQGADLVCTNNALGMRLSSCTVDLIDCQCSHNAGDGFLLHDSTGDVTELSAVHNGGDGLHLTGSCRMTVSDVGSHANGGSGIHLDQGVTSTAVQDCDVRDEAIGIRTQSPGNLLLRNTSLGNGVAYDLEPTTPVVIVTLAQMPQNDNPHANYSS